MTLLRHSAAGFAALTLDGTLGMRLAEQMRYHTGHSPSRSEITSWERSLPVLAQNLVLAGRHPRPTPTPINHGCPPMTSA